MGERLGPKAAEADDVVAPIADRRGLSLRGMLPNAITVAALCAGLTGVRFAIDEQWAFAILAVALAGVLDGVDGRIARLLNAQSRFGAELDSLAIASLLEWLLHSFSICGRYRILSGLAGLRH